MSINLFKSINSPSKEIIISYDGGMNGWYVSEFYKFFHKKFEEESNIKLKFKSFSELGKKFNKKLDNSNPDLFNWFNLILYDESKDHMFIHSWHDYANVIVNKIIKEKINVVGFSACSNITQNLIDSSENFLKIYPSVYYLENWKNLDLINNLYNKNQKENRGFFIGYIYGARENFLNSLTNSKYFILKDKRVQGQYLNIEEYYTNMNKYRFGLSFNGAANICYRDLEIFGLGLINLRQPLNSLTKNPIIKDSHYIEFFTDNIFNKILSGENINDLLNLEFEKLIDENNSEKLKNISNNSREWFLENCFPENQFKILYDIIKKSEFLD